MAGVCMSCFVAIVAKLFTHLDKIKYYSLNYLVEYTDSSIFFLKNEITHLKSKASILAIFWSVLSVSYSEPLTPASDSLSRTSISDTSPSATSTTRENCINAVKTESELQMMKTTKHNPVERSTIMLRQRLKGQKNDTTLNDREPNPHD